MATTSSHESLLALAPTDLPNRRKARYVGDDLAIQLDRLAQRDQVLLANFYRVLTKLLFAMADPSTDTDQKWQEVRLWIQRHPLDDLIDELHELGDASRFKEASESLAKAMHDIRGGALSALLGRLQLLDRSPRTEGELNTLFILTRDHLKIMRSAVLGLDDPRRNADREPKAHAMQLMVDKWHEAVVGPKTGGQSVRMYVDCSFDGALTECCLESAAIDRIFYNIANNACRHSVTERLDMAVFLIPDESGHCLRFVLSNEVSEADAAYLRSITEDKDTKETAKTETGRAPNLIPLFTPRVSTTGSGFGLTVVADFIAGAFGLRNRQEALRERYVGAVLDGRVFRIWFHWPIANQALPPKMDDYHHPQQSLSEP